MQLKLIERDEFLSALQTRFENILEGEGHSVFISGEAGIGKTSVVKAFCSGRKNDCYIFRGTCDALFTPRPLSPLYDIALHMRSDLWGNSTDIVNRNELFTDFFDELSNQKKPVILVFEDIHWADEATLDFIKFLARRITHLQCFFILTYRDDEIHAHHPLRNVLGQLPADSFTRLLLTPLSKPAVEKLATEKGYSGEEVYSISGGNPFYVNEILASYSLGIPDNIKDSILSVYSQQDEKTKLVWKILSILPTGFEIKYLEKMEPSSAAAIDNCLSLKILILKDGLIFFKHELYRKTIEASLSPLLRVELNKKILSLFLESFAQNQEIERIIHHAKNANEYDLVVRYAPIAAKKAASVGAHIEASRLYLSAIEYYQENDKNLLVQLYESYAYECYLTNQIKEAIIYQGKALNIWKEKHDTEKTGNSLRLLSRLWWFEGKRKQAETFAGQAIEVLDNQPSSSAKAMVYSNMSLLKMQSDQFDECRFWGEKAITIAREVDDEETLAHALNNIGTTLMVNQSSMQKGIAILRESLEIALKNSYHEHAARAYTSLGTNGVTMKDYLFAKKILEEGINYCEERDLDSQKLFMLSWKARLYLETGNWKEAYQIADTLLKNENLPPPTKIGALVVVATIKIRRGDTDALPLLLEAKTMAVEITELTTIIPVFLALLEYEWLTGEKYIEAEKLSETTNRMLKLENFSKKGRFYFWLRKTKKDSLLPEEINERHEKSNETTLQEEVGFWEKIGSPYEQALALFEGNEDDKRKSISIIRELDADAIYMKLKREMRTSGIKSIPRGIRQATRSNPGLLTGRELDVLQLLKEGMQNKQIASKLFISAKTVDNHISAILFKLDVNSRVKAVQEAVRLGIIK
jgi:ATP/maltotriose-dependent transcriptional regulator MalT